MGASRKLQTEIDRVLKRVSEGVLDFDNIWDKVHGTENANLKEKFEGDLKKEIKKLQRYRDQIKTWQQSNEAKDKKVDPSYEQALMDARKLIERDMERFKIFEKEMKTKAFSKEGLGQQPKTDPVEKAKSETRDWLNNVVGDLEYQNDNFEAELEGISAKKGKTKNPQLTHLETSITRHKAHILKLELILRLLDNDELSPDQVNEIRYYMEDYIECNQLEFERFSDIDELYASLPLDKVEALEDTLGTSSYVKAALLSHSQQNADQSDEQTSEDRKSDFIPTTPTAKTADEGPLASSSSSTVISCQSAAATSSSLVHSSASVKEVDNDAFADARPSIVIPEIGPDRGIGNEESNQEPISAPMSLSLLSGISSSGVIGPVSSVSESFRNVLSADETTGSSCVSPALASNLSGRMISLQVLKVNDDTISNDYRNAGEGPGVSGSIFTPSVVTSQWRPQSAAAFQNQIEIRGRPEIAPDQREKYIQRLQKLQQQGHGANLSASHLPMQQQENSIIQQFNSQSSPISPHMGVRFNIQSSSQSVIAPTKLQNPVQLSSQNLLVSSLPKDAGDDQAQQHQQRNLYDDMNIEITRSSGFGTIKVDDNLKTVHMASNAMAEVHQLPRYGNLSPGPPLQPGQSSSNVGVIGRGIVSDPGAGVDNLGSSFEKSRDDHFLGLHLLEAALHRLPQTDDSYRYIPKHPAVTPLSFPQTQAGFARDPAFWRNIGFDIMFFSFYYQQNTYQQYMAARELKRQKWRYNKRYNLWLQPHDLKIEADDYEKGTYLLFDYDVVNGWCPRYLQDFVFEYRYREDELDVPDD